MTPQLPRSLATVVAAMAVQPRAGNGEHGHDLGARGDPWQAVSEPRVDTQLGAGSVGGGRWLERAKDQFGPGLNICTPQRA